MGEKWALAVQTVSLLSRHLRRFNFFSSSEKGSEHFQTQFSPAHQATSFGLRLVRMLSRWVPLNGSTKNRLTDERARDPSRFVQASNLRAISLRSISKLGIDRPRGHFSTFPLFRSDRFQFTQKHPRRSLRDLEGSSVV